ncbi:MAG: plastocyanin/azurin family copper-binding protein, partial [Actinomycetota bacterium]|nr:plastocyanin/azurin family copper-binding protein [Actinomycetota bacterium]
FWDLLDPIFEKGDNDYSGILDGPEPEAPEFFEKLPFLTNDGFQVLQSAAQPCFIENGAPDTSDPEEPCEVQEQPAFNGKYDYYNSGFIPYQGQRGNSFSVPLADDIEPGTYHYYCNWHFVEMSGAIVVVPDDDPIPSQEEVNRVANRQAATYTGRLGEILDETAAAKRGPLPRIGFGTTGDEDEKLGFSTAFGNEFVPSTVNAKVNEKVTWTMAGSYHSIAFNVPKYFPVFSVDKEGTVKLDDRGYRAVKFPKTPEQVESDQAIAGFLANPGGSGPDGGEESAAPEEEADAEEGPPPEEEESEPVAIDGGRFDGSGGLRSSGMFYSEGDTFSLTFTKSGTYLFACLVHPAMVGKVVVK